jgi:hypothetical protein
MKLKEEGHLCLYTFIYVCSEPVRATHALYMGHTTVPGMPLSPDVAPWA